MARKRETFEPATMGNLRRYGCRQLLVYCTSGWCHHSAILNADWLADDVPVRSLCPRMVCTVCGLIGADVRPDWPDEKLNLFEPGFNSGTREYFIQVIVGKSNCDKIASRSSLSPHLICYIV